MPTKKQKESFFPLRKQWFKLAALFLILILLAAGLAVGFQAAYADKFLPRVKIGYLNLGGQTKEQALSQLKAIEENIQSGGLKLKSGDKEIIINPIVISAADPDLAKPILILDWQKTTDSAFAVGHDKSRIRNLGDQLKTLILGSRIPASYNLNKEELLLGLKAGFVQLEKPPLNAQLKIEGDKVEVTGEQSGYVFDYEKAVELLVKNIESLSFEPVNLDLVFTEPEIRKEHTGSAVNSIERILAIDSITLNADSFWWKINKDQFVPWLEFQLIDGEAVVGFNQEKVMEFLAPIAETVNVKAQDAKFKLNGNRVAEFQASRDGKTLNLEESYKKINNQIIIGSADDIKLVVEVDPAKVATSDLNDLGIKELIGQGVSNFAGSPQNRRHNIAVGAATLNGILIEPGEDFSLLKALGEIDGAHGYLPELVIKGDRTIPEYGGGRPCVRACRLPSAGTIPTALSIMSRPAWMPRFTILIRI